MAHDLVPITRTPTDQTPDLPPAFGGSPGRTHLDLRAKIAQVVADWLKKSMSPHTRRAYRADLEAFLRFHGRDPVELEWLVAVIPDHVAAWRDAMTAASHRDRSIARRMTALRSLFSYLHTYGYQGANPAHPKFVRTPSVPRDGKTVGIAPRDCRKLLDAPDPKTPVGVRDRAIFALLAYTACRVGELVTMNVESVKTDGEHRIVEIQGKGRKERKGVIPIEARERLADWIRVANITKGPLFRPSKSPRGQGRDGFQESRLTVSRIEKLLKHYVTKLGLDPNITVHSFRVTATTRARELGVDILDLQEYLGHEDPRTTRSYIRDAEKLHRNPAYVLRY